MILTLLLAIGAGWATRPAQPHVTEALVRLVGHDGVPDPTGRRVLTFGLVLALAAVVAGLLDAGGHPLILMLGGLVGYFQQDIREALLARRG